MSNQPVFAVNDEYLIAPSNYPETMQTIPTSKMFVVKQALKKYLADNPESVAYDASQGDGGKSLTGVPHEWLDRANEYQKATGTGYDTPAGHARFRQIVAEHYWQLGHGWGPNNVLAAQGGRDALMKAYGAMVFLGTGRVGDALVTSAVPWISYNWGPYVGGLNVLRAVGDAANGWVYTEDGLVETVTFAKNSGREVAGLVITSPDNPTGRVIPLEDQITLTHKALELGVKYVLFDWIYHYVTDGEPNDINVVLEAFSPEQRNQLMFLDGLTKSLGASNIRSAHLVAGEAVIKMITSHASHGVIPSYYSQAVAMAAYENGYREAAKSTIEPTNASREVLRAFLDANDYEYVIGSGYYAFIKVEEFMQKAGIESSEALGQTLAEQHGVAVVPGVFFSPTGNHWIRFSYALPPERTQATVERLHEGLHAI